MDRGYFNASEFHRMYCAVIEFVTRMKSNVLYETVRESGNRKDDCNPYEHEKAFRKVRVRAL